MHAQVSAETESTTRHLFAYGTLVDPHCLDDVLGHAHQGERLRARLAGYHRTASDAYPYPYIVQTDGSSVDGVLVMDLSPYDIHKLDRYEEVETGTYRRAVVEVEAWGCGPRPLRLRAHAYVAGPTLLGSTGSEPNRNN